MGCVNSALRTAPPPKNDQQLPAQQGPASQAPLEASLPYVYPTFPHRCDTVQCHHVYDGDTLTLQDKRRVRFLGIDTPELQPKEPYAEEAKEFTDALCNHQTLYLQYGPERQDRYGRLLAVVWVRHEGGYLCVNEGLVHSGLASFYQAGNAPLPNSDTLMTMQRSALAARRGLWSDFIDDDVVVTRHGKCYHSPGCEHVSSRRVSTVKKSVALDRGQSGCRTCQAS